MRIYRHDNNHRILYNDRDDGNAEVDDNMYRGYVGNYVEVVGTSGSNPDRENEARATAAPSLLSNGVSLILSAPPEKNNNTKYNLRKYFPTQQVKQNLPLQPK